MYIDNKIFVSLVNPITKNTDYLVSISEFKKEFEKTNVIFISDIEKYNSLIEDENKKFKEGSYKEDEMIFSFFNMKNFQIAQDKHVHKDENDDNHDDFNIYLATIPEWMYNMKADINKFYFTLFDLFNFSAFNLNVDNDIDDREFESNFILVDGKFIRIDAITYVMRTNTEATNNVSGEKFEGTAYTFNVSINSETNEGISFNIFRKNGSKSKENIEKWLKLKSL